MSGAGREFDVAIVGARCAGSPLAMMLARLGLSVCLLDRARFPNDALSTHVIQPCGVAILRRLGVLDDLLAAGAVPLTRLSLVDDDVRIESELDVEEMGAPSISMRRVTLDHLLVKAAEAAGAEVRTGTGVTGLLREDGRVSGVETPREPVRASLVVGADGRGSTVAAEAAAAEYQAEPPGRLFAWAYFEGVGERDGHLRLGSQGDLTFVASPTDAGLYLAAVCPFLDEREAFLADREAGFAAGLRSWPELADILDGATRVGPIRVMVNWHGYFRHAAGPGWALLGDAGHFKDPTPAQGISDALRQAARLADAIAAGLGGAADLDTELRRWWRWRDQDAYEMYRFATDLGSGRSPLLGFEVLRGIAGDEEASADLLRVLNHDIPPAQLFSGRRIGRAVAGAIRRRPRLALPLMREIASEAGNELRHLRRFRPPADHWPASQ
jgi:2-polyprenyl-6-methoxyphenol hydroxylase-like FAD-dependent oxidoreductase